ncbi:hypothetical protein [Acidovorax sp. NCPPB 4044]|uniref:hypothetical protein n=1 Tax=Acidovorax sp. NCPPB 4044 TaxID=2940490 RepID=UPI002303439D|nr:hypothetical protein [Acidovorax sp. NCPPB 4044]MDA8521998.1 hypothetical protein [Acidovorax sp. NCPPB 4044]
MTEVELSFTAALARVTYQKKCSCLKFIDSMIWLSQMRRGKRLTPAQSKYLAGCVIRFQRQISAKVVEVARKELERLKAAERPRERS